MKLRRLLFFVVPLLLAPLAATVAAQSSDQNLPTPVLANEVDGKIAALDLGDSRLTRHFYAFEATPGDLIISINSRNLNGDLDVFTAITFRPLMKISVYANTIPPEVTKSIYLRTKQILILRIEARTPNDDPGTYRLRFSGSFAPFSGGIPVAENIEETNDVAGARPGTKRVSSVGATIPEPPAEVPAATPEPSPTVETAAEKPVEAPKKPAPKTTRRTPTARNPRRRTPAPRPKPKPETETPKTETAKTETEEPKKPAEEAEKPAETTTEKPAPAEKQEPLTPPAGPRLIIEEKDGTRVERPMSTVRRVIVEGNQIVIVLKTGRTERIAMTNVARMAIEP